ncbi:ComEC/Rec2 family competence protein [Patulibacter defluvii]|uniref:ComEC/Rec2 family competence protein n=1 Tax=Patulibacter defluvii TaxID=3095358 RepID=UPI002A75BAEA|nr:ComEC/Rec2 family competence protein [Patulibacter sp. DM4]
MTARWPQHHLVAFAVLTLIAGPRWPIAVPLLAAAAWISQPRRGWAAAAVAAVVLAAVGGSWRTAQAWRAAQAPLVHGAAVALDEPVELLERPRPTFDGGWRADVRLRGATVELRLPVATAPPRLAVGALIRVRGRLRPVGPRARAARARGVALALDGVVAGAPVGRRGGWRGALDGVRERAERTLAPAGGDDRAAARGALLRGMVLGQDDGFSAAQTEAFRRSGLAHLVAASGQNVALVAALVLGLGAVAGVRRRWRIVVAAAAVIAYVPLAGGGASIRRAGVMGVLGLTALALGRPADRWWALLAAALVTVLVDPFSPDQLGWRLSFAAVVGLLLLTEPLVGALRRLRVPPWLALLVAVPLAAGVATAPVLAAAVGDVSLTSLAANVLAEPLVAPITWLGMVAGLLGPEGAPLSGALVAALGPALDWIDGVARWAAAPSWAVVRPGPVAAALPVVAALVVAWVAGAGRRPPAALVRIRRRLGGAGGRQRGRNLAVGRAALAAVAAAAAVVGVVVWRGGHDGTAPRADGVVVLDVGQGSATLLRRGGRAILVDAGPVAGRVLDRLGEEGVERLDALVLTHAAADHTGGAPAVVRRLRPALLVDGTDGRPDPAAAVAAQAVRTDGGQVVRARAGLRIAAGSLRAELRWPPSRPPGPPAADEDPNERAAVVRADVGGLRVLIPSDREGVALRTAAGGPVDLLVLPHHGSADPDLPRLLTELRPRLAVAQVGADNGYGHPAGPTVAALRRAGVPLRRTDRDGTVRIDAPVPGPGRVDPGSGGDGAGRAVRQADAALLRLQLADPLEAADGRGDDRPLHAGHPRDLGGGDPGVLGDHGQDRLLVRALPGALPGAGRGGLRVVDRGQDRAQLLGLGQVRLKLGQATLDGLADVVDDFGGGGVLDHRQALDGRVTRVLRNFVTHRDASLQPRDNRRQDQEARRGRKSALSQRKHRPFTGRSRRNQRRLWRLFTFAVREAPPRPGRRSAPGPGAAPGRPRRSARRWAGRDRPPGPGRDGSRPSARGPPPSPGPRGSGQR